MWIPEAKVYDKSYSFGTMKKYARFIGIFYIELKCSKCSSVGNHVHFHHKNKDKWDNRIKNLLPLCIKCHRNLHEGSSEWKAFHHKHGIIMKKKYAEGAIKIWNKGLNKYNDERIAEYGKKQSIAKKKNPLVLSKKHQKILVESSHTESARIKRSATMKRIWAERKINRGGVKRCQQKRGVPHGVNGNEKGIRSLSPEILGERIQKNPSD